MPVRLNIQFAIFYEFDCFVGYVLCGIGCRDCFRGGNVCVGDAEQVAYCVLYQMFAIRSEKRRGVFGHADHEHGLGQDSTVTVGSCG